MIILQPAMAGGAVQAMQLQVLLEVRLPEESLEGALAHPVDIFELEMIGHQSFHAVDLVAGKSQPPQNLDRHFRAHLDVAIEADPLDGHVEMGAKMAVEILG